MKTRIITCRDCPSEEEIKVYTNYEQIEDDLVDGVITKEEMITGINCVKGMQARSAHSRMCEVKIARRKETDDAIARAFKALFPKSKFLSKE